MRSPKSSNSCFVVSVSLKYLAASKAVPLPSAMFVKAPKALAS